LPVDTSTGKEEEAGKEGVGGGRKRV